jgi:hypothetical protein
MYTNPTVSSNHLKLSTVLSQYYGTKQDTKTVGMHVATGPGGALRDLKSSLRLSNFSALYPSIQSTLLQQSLEFHRWYGPWKGNLVNSGYSLNEEGVRQATIDFGKWLQQEISGF